MYQKSKYVPKIYYGLKSDLIEFILATFELSNEDNETLHAIQPHQPVEIQLLRFQDKRIELHALDGMDDPDKYMQSTLPRKYSHGGYQTDLTKDDKETTAEHVQTQIAKGKLYHGLKPVTTVQQLNDIVKKSRGDISFAHFSNYFTVCFTNYKN